MQHTGSADGTPIAFDVIGRTGTPVLIVGGALSTADAGRPLAAALAESGLRGVVMDRRGRGSSGDSRTWEPQREADDVAAVLAAVGGGAVFGHSSGAVLTLYAASEGMRAKHLFLSEPPFTFGDGEPHDGLAERLQALVDEDRPGDAVTLFLDEGVGMPAAAIESIRSGPHFAAIEAVARTTVYDTLLVGALSTPTPAMLGTRTPVTILRGNPTYPVLATAAATLADAMPAAALVVVPESHDHGVDPAATAGEILRRLR